MLMMSRDRMLCLMDVKGNHDVEKRRRSQQKRRAKRSH
jgi:hypothetical protein